MAIFWMALLWGGLAGWSDPTAAGESARPFPEALVAAPPGCGQFQFTITGSTTVTTSFPTAACGAGPIVVKGGTATWSGTTRVLTVPVRIRNASGQTITQPIRTELPDTGRSVLAPAGQPRTKLIPQTPDGSYADGTSVWFVGASANLAPGDSTSVKQMKIKVSTPVTSGQLLFKITTNEVIVGMPALAPNLEPPWFRHDSSRTAGDSAALKRVLAVELSRVPARPKNRPPSTAYRGS